MKKQIIIGSMLVLALLLLMPSIPAIQIKNMNDVIKQNMDDLITKSGINSIEILDLPDHIMFFLFFYAIAKFRYIRFELNFAFSTATQFFKFVHPIILIRSMFLLLRYTRWLRLCDSISLKY